MSVDAGLERAPILRRTLMALVVGALGVTNIPASANAVSAFNAREISDTTFVDINRVIAAGDVNGDGEPDVLASDCSESLGFVLFGPFNEEKVDPHRPSGSSGFQIVGSADSYVCHHIAGAGDVNSDGLDDLMIGSAIADNNGRTDSGTVYVIFGSKSNEPVRLENLNESGSTDRGFRIDGPYSSSRVAIDLDGASDVNGDGFDDVIIGTPFVAASYVVFGKGESESVDLLEFEMGVQGLKGFRIDTPAPQTNDGYEVAGAGDVNADGLEDVLVGVVRKIRSAPGNAYVIFGKVDPAPVDVNNMLMAGFTIKGLLDGDFTGYSVSGAGNVNGDQYSDVIIGSPRRYSCCRGSASVVFGKADTESVSLADLDGRGFRIKGLRKNGGEDGVGTAVDGLGDVNDDGRSDVLVGAPYLGIEGEGGSAYVIYGKRRSEIIRLRRLGQHGYRIDGGRYGDLFGEYLDGAGDMNGDDVPDFLVGAPGTNHEQKVAKVYLFNPNTKRKGRF